MEDLSTPQAISEEDETLDLTLRPKTWDRYIGQEKVKKNLRVIIDAAKQRKEPIEHLLFYGGSGLGKTTISHIIANDLKANIRVIAGPTVEKVGDLAAILTNLNEGDVLFIDECHRINKMIEEFLYPAMEDFKLNLILGKGPMARTMELKLPRFTLIGATTRLALLSAPLRNRFGATFQLDYYKEEEMEKIIKRSSDLLEIKTDPEALKIIAKCSRSTPRVANRLVKRLRDYAQVKGQGIITAEIAQEGLRFLDIDHLGLEPSDRKILMTLINKFNGGPVGIQALAAASFEEQDAILDVYEPYLMQLGFIERTPKGRVATPSAYTHLKLPYNKPPVLFN
ncbi:Holliday junction branch migration DNA helicase RuvB [Patescibacteria group bacterium]|nr:Holliday junction branch migration DNA helicase RuvB [Patescibacteria group bacterium]